MTEHNEGVARLRLTGAQLASIQPPVDARWFTDWDEFREFEDVTDRSEVQPDLRAALEALRAIRDSWWEAINKRDMPAPIYRASVLTAMAVWPKGARGDLAIGAYESLVERLEHHDAVVSAALATTERLRAFLVTDKPDREPPHEDDQPSRPRLIEGRARRDRLRRHGHPRQALPRVRGLDAMTQPQDPDRSEGAARSEEGSIA